MRQRRLSVTTWIVAPIVALSAAVACSSGSDETDDYPNKGGQAGASASQGGHVESSGGNGGEFAAGGSAGQAATSNGGAEAGGSTNAASGGDLAAGTSGETAGSGNGGSAGDLGGGSDAGGSTNGEVGGESAAGAGGTTSGGTANAACIKTVKAGYVVRTDGKVLVEQRDTTKEAAILDADGKPLSGAVDVAIGTYHGCGLLSNGTVECWRETASRGNWAGQLGNGSVDQDASAKLERASQVLIDSTTPLTGVTALTRGGPGLQSTCAITNEQKMYCWGDLAWLVNGGTAIASPYAQAITTNGIDPLTGVQQASTSVYMACAVVKHAGNELYCWGRNDYHNLGTGDQKSHQYPIKVAGLTSPTSVTVADYSYALTGGGTACVVDGGKLLCWGANGSGQTGTNTSGADVIAPTTVVIQDGTTALPAPLELASISGTTCALLSNKTVWCWGNYFNAAAGNYGATNVASLGGPWAASSNLLWLFYATTDGQYHWGKEWARSPNCGAL